MRADEMSGVTGSPGGGTTCPRTRPINPSVPSRRYRLYLYKGPPGVLSTASRTYANAPILALLTLHFAPFITAT